MLNQVVLVGRLVRDIEVKKAETGKNVATLTLAIPRSFKNQEGTYDTDFINCTLWDSTALNTSTYCHKGDVVGIKGRLQTNQYTKDEKQHTIMEVISEKVTFLSSKKTEE